MTDEKVSNIKVGNRHRTDLGDIASLAASIEAVGLLHPIVIRPDRVLIAGERRLEAVKRLGWTEIPVTIAPLEDIVRGELAENAERKDFLPSEIDAIRRAIQPVEREAAHSRRLANLKPVDESSGKISRSDEGRVRDKIGFFAGVCGRTVEKIAAVVEAAKAEPEKFGHLVDDMDRTGRVDGPHKRLLIPRQAESIRGEPPPLPSRGPYRVIVVDPPWPFELDMQDTSWRALRPYATMSIEQIHAMTVSAIVHDDTVLWLWTTNFHIREAFSVLELMGLPPRLHSHLGQRQNGTGPLATEPDRARLDGRPRSANRHAHP